MKHWDVIDVGQVRPALLSYRYFFEIEFTIQSESN